MSAGRVRDLHGSPCCVLCSMDLPFLVADEQAAPELLTLSAHLSRAALGCPALASVAGGRGLKETAEGVH